MTDVQPHEPPQTPGAVAVQSLGPVLEKDRIATLDVLRGFAILGIFLVNLQFFAYPMMAGVMPDHAAMGPLDELAWAFVKTFCEMKFVSMFSMLFGAGMVVLYTRTQARGGSFVPLYLRRLVILLGFGAIHAFGFWYGDILLIYAGLGVFLLLMRNLSAKTLAIIGVILLVVDFVVVTGCSGLNMLSMQQAVPAGAEEPLFGWEAIQSAQFNPFHEDWLAAEEAAYKNGPYADALVFRSITWVMMVVFSLFGFMQRVFGMFLIGAALMKAGVFAPAGKGTAARLALLVIPGLLLELTATAVLWKAHGAVDWRMIPATAMHDLGATCLSLGYVGVIATICAGGAPTLLRPIASVGRMALTCYLGETLIATFVMYHWGLGRFGDFSRAELIVFALVVYAVLMVFATVWLKAFRMGPLEWVWRSLTYLHPQSLRHAG